MKWLDLLIAIMFFVTAIYAVFSSSVNWVEFAGAWAAMAYSMDRAVEHWS